MTREEACKMVLTINEAMEFLDMSKPAIHQAIKGGHLTCLKEIQSGAHTQRLFWLEDLEHYKATKRHRPKTPRNQKPLD